MYVCIVYVHRHAEHATPHLHIHIENSQPVNDPWETQEIMCGFARRHSASVALKDRKCVWQGRGLKGGRCFLVGQTPHSSACSGGGSGAHLTALAPPGEKHRGTFGRPTGRMTSWTWPEAMGHCVRPALRRGAIVCQKQWPRMANKGRLLPRSLLQWMH